MDNQYQIIIKSEEKATESQFAGTETPSGSAGKGSSKEQGSLKKFASGIAAIGLVSSVKNVESYLVGRVETWTGNKTLQDQINVLDYAVSNAVSFGVAAATGPLGLVAWGIGKATSFGIQAADFYYNKSMETLSRQLNAERQSKGSFFE